MKRDEHTSRFIFKENQIRKGLLPKTYVHILHLETNVDLFRR